MSQNPNTSIAVVGIDIGKNSFHIVGLDQRGAIVLRQKWTRGQMEARLANMPPCLIGMEACVGAHHLSRKLRALGHDARLMPARYVRPYSKGQKNDFRDAEAIAEAVQRPTMQFVATKTADQLDLQALHWVRDGWLASAGIINQIRAFLLERGVAVRQGLRFLRAELPRILATPPDVLSPRMVRIVEGLAGDWRRLDERVEVYRVRLGRHYVTPKPLAGLLSCLFTGSTSKFSRIRLRVTKLRLAISCRNRGWSFIPLGARLCRICRAARALAKISKPPMSTISYWERTRSHKVRPWRSASTRC